MLDTRYNVAFKLYPYARVAAQDEPAPMRHPVVVIGGGPVGMAMALDLGLAGTPVLVLDDHDGVGQGSRAICFAKRTLEITDRLGCGDEMLDKGVVWNVGKVFHAERQVFEFNLLPEGGHKMPAFINLQQPYFEKFLVDRVREVQAQGAPIEIRGCNRVVGLTNKPDAVVLDVETPEGLYQLEADWVVACDGARSPTRDLLKLGFEGRVFEDNFLIADVRMTAPFPTERWFWFEPPFENSGQSALLHKQPDDIWRIDFQLGWDIDREAELDPERIRSRVDAMLGEGVEYDVVWTSIYTFQCRRMEKFRHGRVLFAGDSAHQVSPFGARGANSGIQDVDNLGWKLKLVIDDKAPEQLLDTYALERELAADENVLNSTRSTDFLTPKSAISKVFRNAVLDLAQQYTFARPLVNSGRLSVPCIYQNLPHNGPDALSELDEFAPARTCVGASCVDVPLGDEYLLNKLGSHFTLLTINTEAPEQITVDGVAIHRLALNCTNAATDDLAIRYLGNATSAVYLIRPDQHVAARWRQFDKSEIEAALRSTIGKDTYEA